MLNRLTKEQTAAGHQWPISVILATWEVETRMMVGQGQPGQIVNKTPSPK
jgi:hypothetical protein